MPPAIPPTTKPPRPDAALLERNLASIARRQPQIAQSIHQARARDDLELAIAPDSGITGTLGTGPTARSLASKRQPLTEAQRFADTIDLASHGAVAVAGFGLGHHLAAIADKAGQIGVLIVYEPDLALLRAVLERIDCSAWIERTHLVVLTDPADAAGLVGALSGLEALVALGVQLAEHPASRPRLGDSAEAFAQTVTSVVRSIRTTITTTLVQAETTLRNGLMNLDHYANAAPLADLVDCARGRCGVVIAAGPSLSRNLDLLAQPGVRDRCVLIATQTVLRPMLERGIRPHLVVALDHHEISTRFYEGLTADDVAGVTLVVEPKVNPAVIEAFPGAVRCARDEHLDALLGPNLARPMGTVEPGATVAHLAYFLARLCGCDPVVLIGQDLGFTDGQYYAAGAAIHRVWSCELNPFRTLEMFEWERIVRGRLLLTRTTDQQGRPIYTDEQMHNYLTSFEQRFAADAARGLRVIDATEGGVAKAHTQTATLADVLDALPPGPPVRLPVPGQPATTFTSDFFVADDWTDAALASEPDPARMDRLAQRIRTVRQQAWRVGELSRKARDLLGEMLEHQRDQARVNTLIGRVDAIRDEITQIQPAFDLVQFLNQTGGLNRLKADRLIELDADLTPIDRQARQIERDRTNVTWLADAADQLGAMLDATIAMLAGGPRLTRDPPPKASEQHPRGRTNRSVAAVIPVDLDRSALGTPRDLAQPVLLATNALDLTLARLARADRIDRAVLMTDQPERLAAMLAPVPPGLRIEIVQTTFDPVRRCAVAAARLFAPTCWRGAPAGLTAYDELFDPAALAPILTDLDIELAVLVGADWALIDPQLCDQILQRAHEAGDRLAFSQAPPGLGPCVIDRSFVHEIAAQLTTAGPLASVGGVLGYLPAAPRADQIARPWCVTIPASVRDLPMRVIPDSPASCAHLARALDQLGPALLDADAATIAHALAACPDGSPCPQLVELAIGGTRPTARARWLDPAAASSLGEPMPPALAESILAQLADTRPDLAVTFTGPADPLSHPHILDLIDQAKRAGIASVHVRTDLACAPELIERLAGHPVDILSVDLLATQPATYAQLTGLDQLDAARANLEQLITLTRTGPTLTTPWIVPRITRCDAVYEQIEPFYDNWLSRLGACVIDPLDAPIPGDRIAPLPIPKPARSRLDHRLVISARGLVRTPDSPALGDLRTEPLDEFLANRSARCEHGVLVA